MIRAATRRSPTSLRTGARAVVAEAGMTEVIVHLDRRPPGADTLDPGDPYVERVIPPPPFTDAAHATLATGDRAPAA
jgi:hypothetical protein